MGWETRPSVARPSTISLVELIKQKSTQVGLGAFFSLGQRPRYASFATIAFYISGTTIFSGKPLVLSWPAISHSFTINMIMQTKAGIQAM